MTETEQLLGDNITKALDSSKEKMLDKDKDFVLLVTGEEGNGKSSLALLMADYWDEDFDPGEQICMDHEQVIRTADELDAGQAIVFDEGIEALLSRNHGSKSNRIMLEWFREVRAKNLFIVICMPEWKEIEKPIRDDRAHGLVRIVKQGFCHFFNEGKMNQIRVDSRGNKKRVEYPDYLFRSGWRDPAGTDLWSVYQSMKRENVSNLAEKYLENDESSGTDYEKKYRKLRRKVVKTFVNNLDMTIKDSAEIVGVSEQAVHKWKRNGKWSNLPPFDVSSSPKLN